jgi:broad specificity phosphatase PhoE
VGLVYLVQHAQKRPEAGDPGLTELGVRQAEQTGEWLRGRGLSAVFSSPARRARGTAGFLGAAGGLQVQLDERLRERLNWADGQPVEEFLTAWARCERDRDYVPPGGDSSRQAAARLRAFLDEHIDTTGAVAAVTHGGVTVDLLRTLLGDDEVTTRRLWNGVTPCAITTWDGHRFVDVARTGHLTEAL